MTVEEVVDAVDVLCVRFVFVLSSSTLTNCPPSGIVPKFGYFVLTRPAQCGSAFVL